MGLNKHYMICFGALEANIGDGFDKFFKYTTSFEVTYCFKFAHVRDLSIFTI